MAERYGVVHLSSGDLFRHEVEARTDIGLAISGYLERGELVPDQLVIEMLSAPVLEAVSRGGYVLDGFPRSLPQAEEAYRVAQQVEGIELQAVVHLEVPADELHRRLLARAASQGRADDNELTIQRRLEVYESETRPMLRFYASRGLVVDINGDQAVDDVFADIVGAVDALRVGLS